MTFEDSAGATLGGLLRARAMRQAHAPALLAPDRSPLTYGGLWQQAQRLARALNARGVGPSTRVALVLPNGPEMAAAALGVAAYAACVPLNPGCARNEFRTYLTEARVRLVIVLQTERGPIRAVAEELGLPLLEVETNAALAAGEFHIGATIGEDIELEPDGKARQHALVLHTSGTTARPKVVPLSHANVVASAQRIAQHLALSPGDRCLNVMPLFHAHGLIGALAATIVAGGSVVCTPGFDSRLFFGWIAQLNPTWYTAVPTIHQWVVSNGGLYSQAAPAHRFRFVRSCSAALSPKTLQALQTLTGSPVIEAYGMTEASHQIASNPLSELRKAGSVGVPAGAEIRVVDRTGNFLDGTAGEIVVRGAGVMAGYDNDGAANADAFVDGWFRTGDQGRFDEDGYLFITGRIKDIINRGGETISPREIDEALLEHEDVVQAVAFSIPHPTLEQDVAAAVVLRDGATADESALRCFLLERLAASKVPSTIVFPALIPTEATGKIQRASLYDRLRDLFSKRSRAPTTATEKSLEAIFRSVLYCEGIGANDNFFALGGDSLKAAQVVSRILARHSVELAIPALFRHGTIAELAVAIDAATEQARKCREALAAEIEQMSDEEVARFLAEEERRERSS